MTIINPNSISGIVSVTATSNALHFYESDGDKLNINADLTGNVTGNITGTTATFSGDVTVGGVLSYEDVTNIDSVGLGTFRDGLHVTGGSIGIKNTSPNNTLTVGDTVQPSYAPTRAGNYIEIARTSGADAGLLINKNTGQWLLGINNGDGANAPLRFEYAAAGSAHPGFGAGTLGMIIKHDGKIGIGTDNPNSAAGLDVLNGEICARGIRSNAHKPISGVWLGKATSGNALIEVVGDTGTTAEIDFTTPNTDTKGRIAYDLTDDYMYFYTNGANERLRITSTGSIGISSTAPKTDVDISQKTGAVALPQGTTAQRPTGSAPYIRKNTTNNALEYYDGTSWVEIITDYFPTGSVILG